MRRSDLVIALLLSGVYLFAKGFFLTRIEVRSTSTCAEPPAPLAADKVHSAVAGAGGDCWLPQAPRNAGNDQHPKTGSFRRLVLLIIDGWRFDFADPNVPAAALPPGHPSRLDVARPPEFAVATDGTQHYRGHMHHLRRLLLDSGHGNGSARLFRFIADPPTVTMQRLKGLTSGSLPTFVDASANFASSAIAEDNLISQFATARPPGAAQRAAAAAAAATLGSVRAGEAGIVGAGVESESDDMVQLGDDTWQGLFPSQFTASRPFPSFDVRDLHTVDDGVLAHLLPAIRGTMLQQRGQQQRQQGQGAGQAGGDTGADPVGGDPPSWRLIVGHFLGVDHVGHRYSTPAHPAMAAKLRQMDETIAAVAGAIDGDTLLAVMGDHGMTSEGGNHGGASSEEVEAALLLFARRDDLFLPEEGKGEVKGEEQQSGGGAASGPAAPGLPSIPITTVSQVDAVPTLSLLLGLPVPYASLGAVLPGVNFNSAPAQAWAGDGSGSSSRGSSSSRSGSASLLPLASSCAAHHVNAHQLLRYLHAYNGVAGTFAGHELGRLAADVRSGDAGLQAALAELLLLLTTQQRGQPVQSEGRGHQSSQRPREAEKEGEEEGLAGSAAHLRGAIHAQEAAEGSAEDAASLGSLPPLQLYERLLAAAAASQLDASAPGVAPTPLPAAALRRIAGQLEAARQLHRRMLLASAALCRALWTRFSEPAMVAGIAAMAAAVALADYAVFGPAGAGAVLRGSAPGSTADTAAARDLSLTAALALVARSAALPIAALSLLRPQGMAAGALRWAEAAADAISALHRAVAPTTFPELRASAAALALQCQQAADWARLKLPEVLPLLAPAVYAAAGGTAADAVLAGSIAEGAALAGAADAGPQPLPSTQQAAGGWLSELPVEVWLPVALVVAFACWPHSRGSATHTKECGREDDAAAAEVPALGRSGQGEGGAGGQQAQSCPAEDAARIADTPPDVAEGVVVASTAQPAALRQRRRGTQAADSMTHVAGHTASAEQADGFSGSSVHDGSRQLPGPASAGSPQRSVAVAACALVLLLLRCDALFTNSFVVAEHTVIGHLLAAALLLCWLDAMRRVARGSSSGEGSSGEGAQVSQGEEKTGGGEAKQRPDLLPSASLRARRLGALATAALLLCLLATRLTLQRDGWLWPFPPSDVAVSTAAAALPEGAEASGGTATAGEEPAPGSAASPSPAPRVETGTGKSSIGWVLEAAVPVADPAAPSPVEHSTWGPWRCVLLPLATPLLIVLAASAACALLRSSNSSGKGGREFMRCRWPGAAATAAAAVALVVATCGQAAAALYWFAQQTPASAIASPSPSSAPSHAAVLSRLLLSLLRQLVSPAATPGGVHAPAHATAHASVLEASPLLRLGLPRAVYAATLLSLAALAALQMLRRRQLHTRHAPTAGGRADTFGSSSSAPALLLWWPALLFCCALPSLSLLLGHGSPVLLLCMPLHALGLAVLRLLATGTGTGSGPGLAERASAAAAAPVFLLQRAGACIGSLLASPLTAHSLALSWSCCHYYLASGHGNQFNSLHFSAPFVGFDGYHPVGSTLLLLANTLSAHLTFFGLFSLDFTDAPTCGRQLPPLHGPRLSGGVATVPLAPRPRRSGDAPGVLALVLPNAIALLCTSTFCCIARRHLMVWAIFAPKFVFDTLHLAAAVAIAMAARAAAAVAAGLI
jgi:predicted AlkP superfamily pyrophosphatase or phosphodiesterase